MSTTLPPVSTEKSALTEAYQRLRGLANDGLDLLRAGAVKIRDFASKVLTSFSSALKFAWNKTKDGVSLALEKGSEWGSFALEKGREWGSFIFKRGSELLTSAIDLTKSGLKIAFDSTKSGLKTAKDSIMKTSDHVREFLVHNKKELGFFGAGAAIALALIGAYTWMTGSEKSR